MTMKTRWTVTIEDTEEGDLILPLPSDMLETLGWVEGDTLEWKEDEDGSWILEKVKK